MYVRVPRVMASWVASTYFCLPIIVHSTEDVLVIKVFVEASLTEVKIGAGQTVKPWSFDGILIAAVTSS